MRYRILYSNSLHDENNNLVPIGIVREQKDGVEILAPQEECLIPKETEPYLVLQRDLSEIKIVPGTPEYFNQVCYTLSRTHPLGQEYEYVELEILHKTS